MPDARDVDNASRCALAQPIEQQRRQQERADVIGPERELEAALGHPAPARQARVVDEDMQRLAGTEELVGARPHRFEISQIEVEELDGGRAGQGDNLVEHRPSLLL